MSFSKRVFDIAVTLLAAISWVPAFFIAALALLVFEGRPILYVSRRVVTPGRTIPVLKFRTMVRNAEQVYNRNTVPVTDGVRFLNATPDSNLYTPTGRLIEALSFTEIPQLLHVLRGEMSLVGNRPLPENVMDSLREAYGNVDDRLATPAGLAGPVQLVGRERISDRERLDLESTYCRIASRRSTWILDFLILLFTVLAAARLRAPMKYPEAREFLIAQSGMRRTDFGPAVPQYVEAPADGNLWPRTEWRVISNPAAAKKARERRPSVAAPAEAAVPWKRTAEAGPDARQSPGGAGE